METQFCHYCSKLLNIKLFRTLANKKRSKKCKGCQLKSSVNDELTKLQNTLWFNEASEILNEETKTESKLFWCYSDSTVPKIDDELTLDNPLKYNFFHFEGEHTIIKQKVTDLFRSSKRKPENTVLVFNLKSSILTKHFTKLINYLINDLKILYIFVFTEAHFPSYEKDINVKTTVFKSVADIVANDWMSSINSDD